MLAQIVCGTLAASGRRVLYADVAATPTLGVMVRAHQAAGGVQISASHNPAAYNGLKLFDSAGRVLPKSAGEPVLAAYREQLPDRAAPDAGSKADALKLQETTAEHLRLIRAIGDAAAIRDRKFRVLLDSNAGSGSLLGKELLTALGCEVTLLGGTPDGGFLHPPEPTSNNLAGVCQQVVAAKADVGFCQDPDADRL